MRRAWPKIASAVAGVSLLCLSILWIFLPGQGKAHPLRIGINPWPAYEYLHLAQVAGLFAQEGIDVELIEFMALADARRAFERGQIDGLGTTATDVLLSRHRSSSQLQIVQVIDESVGGDVLLAREGIDGVADLVGKSIGLESGTVSAHLLARALEQARIDPARVRLVSADQISLAERLRNGQIDALVSYPPYSVQLEAEGKARRLFDSRSLPGEIVDVIAFDRSIVEKRPREVAAVIAAYRKAQALAVREPHRSDSIMAAREKLGIEEFRAALRDGIRLVGPDEQRAFLGQDGRLERSLGQAEAALRGIGEMVGTGRSRGISTDRFLGEGD